MKRTGIVLAASFAIVAGMCWWSVVALDESVARACHDFDGGTRLVWRWLTHGGDALYVVPLIGMSGLYCHFVRKSWRATLACVFVFTCVAASGITADLIKLLCGRTRPRLLFRENAYDFEFFHIAGAYTSFPSGHTAVAMAAALALGYLFPAGRIPFVCAAVLVATSRVCLTAHYTSDVIFGAYTAAVVTWCIKAWAERLGLGLFPYAGTRAVIPSSGGSLSRSP